MKTLALLAFSARGLAVARRLGEALAASETSVCLASPRRFAGGIVEGFDSAALWLAEHFGNFEALVFVGSCGLTVRLVAPLLKDKASDPAVVVLDETERYAVSLLSGHLGGANDLAEEVARLTGAEAVITTATDRRGIEAVDLWARRQGYRVENKEAIVALSSAQLEGNRPGWWSFDGTAGPEGFDNASSGSLGAASSPRRDSAPFDVTLWLRPPVLSLGVGCRRDTTADHLEEELCRFLDEKGWAIGSIAVLASVDLKVHEEGLLELARRLGVETRFFDALTLMALPGQFSFSERVMAVASVDCVCERAALVASEDGRLVETKWSHAGVTFALALRG